MTPQTPPTDRPLTAGDVPLLREGAEPVAYRWMWPCTNEWHYADYNLHPDAETVQPLYTALASPPVSERERELEGALRNLVAHTDGLTLPATAQIMRERARALTAQPAGEGK